MSAHRRRRKSPASDWTVVIVGISITLLVGGAVYAVHSMRSHADPAHTAEIGAAQEMVKAKFGSAGRFAPLEETSFTPIEDGKFRVSGEVDVISPNGSAARYFYTVIMHRSDGGSWMPDDVSLVPI
jgi:hypothetical protein